MVEAGVAEGHHLFLKPLDEGLERGLVDMGRITVPGDDEAELVQDQAELASADPAVVGLALLADLSRAPSLPHGMNQFNPVRVDDPEACGRGPEAVRLFLMGPPSAKEVGALRPGGT